jgi:nicotinamide-nucleotide amidase
MPDLVEKLINKLSKSGKMLTTAESCTGGLIASAITGRAGSSKVFDRGFVTYSNQSKMDLLDVPESVLEQNGAVSKLCAEAMVKGALEHSAAHLALAVTGIAGPDGGTEEKPVGLVYIGYGLRDELPKVVEYNFRGNRETVRMQSVKHALQHGIELLKKR